MIINSSRWLVDVRGCIGGQSPVFFKSWFHLTSEGGYGETASSYIVPPWYKQCFLHKKDIGLIYMFLVLYVITKFNLWSSFTKYIYFSLCDTYWKYCGIKWSTKFIIHILKKMLRVQIKPFVSSCLYQLVLTVNRQQRSAPLYANYIFKLVYPVKYLEY